MSDRRVWEEWRGWKILPLFFPPANSFPKVDAREMGVAKEGWKAWPRQINIYTPLRSLGGDDARREGCDGEDEVYWYNVKFGWRNKYQCICGRSGSGGLWCQTMVPGAVPAVHGSWQTTSIQHQRIFQLFSKPPLQFTLLPEMQVLVSIMLQNVWAVRGWIDDERISMSDKDLRFKDKCMCR